MRAVILAAGEGSRMNGAGSDEHKALRKILGISIIERGILALRDAGVRHIVVVVGYAGDKVRHALGDGSRLGVSIEYVENRVWRRGNGTSVYAARNTVGNDEFIVAMADHWYEPEIAKLLVANSGAGAVSKLCVDLDTGSPLRADEATRVQVIADGSIAQVGKELSEFNAIDCGLFLFNRDIFGALQQGFASGEYELGAAANRLASTGRLEMVDVEGFFWEDVDTEDELKSASRKLRRSLPGSDDGLIAKYLNRRLSVPMSMIAIKARLTPNIVSLLALMLAVFAGVAFAFGNIIAGAIAVQLASIVDGSDGEVARARFMSSKRGGLVDSVFDRVADGFILGGAGYHVLTGSPESWEFAIVLMAVAIAPMSMILKDRFQLATGRKWQSELDDGAARVLLATRDGRLFVLFLGGLLNLLAPALAFVAITGTFLLAWRLVLAWTQMAPGQMTPITVPVETPEVAPTLSQSGSAAGGD